MTEISKSFQNPNAVLIKLFLSCLLFHKIRVEGSAGSRWFCKFKYRKEGTLYFNEMQLYIIYFSIKRIVSHLNYTWLSSKN